MSPATIRAARETIAKLGQARAYRPLTAAEMNRLYRAIRALRQAGI